MDIVLPPLFFPPLSFKDDRKGATHLDSIANRHIWGGFVIEEPENMIIQVCRSAGELDTCVFIELTESKFFVEISQDLHLVQDKLVLLVVDSLVIER